MGNAGPVCWSKAPEGWVDCGFGYAKSTAECVTTTLGQVFAVGEASVFFASLGTSGAALPATAAAKIAKLA